MYATASCSRIYGPGRIVIDAQDLCWGYGIQGDTLYVRIEKADEPFWSNWSNVKP